MTKSTRDPRLSFSTLLVLRSFLNVKQEVLAGSDISKKINIPSGTLYPILRRLENAGWLKGEWENIDLNEAGRPARHNYRLTALGTQKTEEAMKRLGL